ncbi:hypothetical protein BH10PLA1_BH10PLA1_09630 [soil metagenome]
MTEIETAKNLVESHEDQVRILDEQLARLQAEWQAKNSETVMADMEQTFNRRQNAFQRLLDASSQLAALRYTG